MNKKESMTALTSLFARAWHNEEYAVRVMEDTTSRFFTLYNRANPQNPLNAFENTSLCLAVRK